MENLGSLQELATLEKEKYAGLSERYSRIIGLVVDKKISIEYY